MFQFRCLQHRYAKHRDSLLYFGPHRSFPDESNHAPHQRRWHSISDFRFRKTSGDSGPAGVLSMAGHNSLSLPNLSPAHLPVPAAAAQLLSGLPAPLGSTGAWPEALPAPPPVAAPVSAFLGSTQGWVKRQQRGLPPSAITPRSYSSFIAHWPGTKSVSPTSLSLWFPKLQNRPGIALKWGVWPSVRMKCDNTKGLAQCQA